MVNVEKRKISIVVPFFNEEAGIDVFYQVILKVINSLPHYSFEVLCVDDGSTDTTLSKLIELVNKDNRFLVLELSRNFGKESALSAGLDAATGCAVIPLDADLQDPPELISSLLAEWEKGADVVLACRTDRQTDSLLKRLSAKAFYRTHNLLSNIEIPEDVGDFRLMDRSVVQAVKQLPESNRFMKGLFAWVGFKSVKVGYIRAARTEGSSRFSGRKLWNFALDGLTSFSIAPLRVWTYIGGVGAVLTSMYAFFIITRTLVLGVDVPGYASLLVAVLFFGSLQLVSIGMLGEYIGRTYMESKRRPCYLIRKVYQNES
ncbi:glycosyltransferase family 2 protein [Methylobacter sp.]|uniref:glycosyltransferase family 2 protein n=1 Tax=Methylobacter sp. TaxID=2051955 RepID=UPI0012186339|nr:glycosyltransferase family 2 protein [Methylobacter sp.]TAK61351.1 MAG: glycosyltransferase [Methylobacter sp.]